MICLRLCGGPYGAKGIGEMTSNIPAPAILGAIHDAVGVWIEEIPVTPERRLRALEEGDRACEERGED